jgi:hypothetical protein
VLNGSPELSPKTEDQCEPLDFDAPRIIGHQSFADQFKRTETPNNARSILSAGGGRIDRAEIRKRCGAALNRNLPIHLQAINTATDWAIIGGGPSINDCLPQIRALKRRGANIVSVNKSHDWLLDHCITPWGHVLLDPKEWVADYVKRPRRDVRYFVASQCHDDVFERLKGYPVFLWHASQDCPEAGPGIAEPDCYLKEMWPQMNHRVVGGGTTVGQRAMILGHGMGTNRFHLFGFDSSRDPNGKLHGYDKPEAQDATCGTMKYEYRGKKYAFETNSHMARQHMDFDQFVEMLPARYAAKQLRRQFRMIFYGSGLTPFWAATLGYHADPECNENPELVGGFKTLTAPTMDTPWRLPFTLEEHRQTA